MNILKHLCLFVTTLVLGTALAWADTSYVVHSGDTLSKIARQNHISLSQLVQLNPQIKNINLIYPGETIYVAKAAQPPVITPPITHPAPEKPMDVPPAPPSPTPPSPVPVPPISDVGEDTFLAYVTGYSYWDNTPPGSTEISDPVIHPAAGGTGTYQDPITLAVGHSITGGKDSLDYAAGTRFYLPFLKKYAIVEDTCGDGSKPQNGPCHTGFQGHPWIDLYVGKGASKAQSDSCMDALTDIHPVIKHPLSTYPVLVGEVANGCKIMSDI